MQVVVIGGGIVGASIAYHLARSGAVVTLLDQREPVGGTTAASFAWLNGSSGKSEDYVRLRHSSLQAWRDLDQTLAGALELDWSGCVFWRPGEDETRQFVAERQSWDYPVSLIERDRIAEMEPNIIDPPAVAAYLPGEGSLMPVAVTKTLLTAASEAGAEIRHRTPVLGINRSGRAVSSIEIPGGTIPADCIVVAAGTESRAIAALAGADVPMTSTAAFTFYCKPGPRVVNGLVVNAGLEMRQDASGRFISVANIPEDEPAPWGAQERLVRAELDAIARQVRGAENLEVEQVVTGYRPIPPDGFPMAGFVPDVDGLYVAAMHSGVSLAAIIGRYAAEEIIEGRPASALTPFRPGRFAEAGGRGASVYDRSF